jgi:hypothetical protein
MTRPPTEATSNCEQRGAARASASLSATSAGVELSESLLAKTASLSAAPVRIFAFLVDFQL